MAFSGYFNNGCCSRALPVLNYEPRYIVTRQLHALNQRGRCQGVIAYMD